MCYRQPAPDKSSQVHLLAQEVGQAAAGIAQEQLQQRVHNGLVIIMRE